MPKHFYLRRETILRIMALYRQKQKLETLLRKYEREWPKKKRQYFEWSILAQLFEETGNQEKAIWAYQNSLKKSPYELDTHRRLIKLLERAGRPSSTGRTAIPNRISQTTLESK